MIGEIAKGRTSYKLPSFSHRRGFLVATIINYLYICPFTLSYILRSVPIDFFFFYFSIFILRLCSIFARLYVFTLPIEMFGLVP